ncbi:MAG: outer membrane beta-barrel protein [Thioalkalivibrio sp.]
MPLRTSLLTLALALALMLILPLAVHAQTRVTGPELEVYLNREVSDWRLEGDSKVESRMNRLGLRVRDRVGDNLWIGIHGGYLELTQSGNPVTQGMDLGGWYLGSSARWRFVEVGPASLSLLGQYTYNEADDTLGDQTTRYTWHEYGAGLESGFTMDALRIRLGVDYTGVDGDEKSSGPVQRTLSLAEEESVTARAALDLLVDATGRITIQVETGARRGAGIWFARQF